MKELLLSQPSVYGLQQLAGALGQMPGDCTAPVNSSCVSLCVPGILTTLFTVSICRFQVIKREEQGFEI